MVQIYERTGGGYDWTANRMPKAEQPLVLVLRFKDVTLEGVFLSELRDLRGKGKISRYDSHSTDDTELKFPNDETGRRDLEFVRNKAKEDDVEIIEGPAKGR